MAKRKVIVNKKKTKKENKAKEVSRLGGALRSIGGLGGTVLGGLIGQPINGGNLGTSLGASFSKWLGAGDYSVKSNSLVNTLRSSSSIPSMHSQNQCVVIRHKEFVADVIAGTGVPTAFNVFNAYALNPGLPASFPWLSTIAQNFQEYTWKGVIYHYVPTSGSSVASTNASLGSVMMATNYRSTLPAYTSKTYLLNEYFSCDSRPSETFCHPIECDPKENPYNVQYVRTGAVPTGEDPKTYDLGVVTVATQGVPAASVNLGEIWVTYEVELRKPIPLGELDTDSPFSTVNRTGITTTTADFGTTTSFSEGDLISSVSPTTITFRKGVIGKILVIISYTATAVSAWGLVTYTVSNCTLSDNVQFGGTVTGPSGSMTNFVTLLIPDGTFAATLTTSSNAFTGTVSGMSILATQVHPDLGA